MVDFTWLQLFSPSIAWRIIASLAVLIGVSSKIITAQIDRDITLTPSAPYELKVEIGKAQLVQFYCWGGPADAVITLKTYAEHSDPLLFVSMARGTEPRIPTVAKHDLSTFDQWKEDSTGDHHVTLNAVGPQGGMLGVLNMQHFAKEDFEGILYIRCDYIISFETLFWDFMHSSVVCPIGEYPSKDLTLALPSPNFRCSGHGQCGHDSVCMCDAGYVGTACQHEIHDMVAVTQRRYDVEVRSGHYRYFRIRVPPTFRGGFLDVNVSSEVPLVVLINGADHGLPSKSKFQLSNFDTWLAQRNFSRLQFRIDAGESVKFEDNRRLAVDSRSSMSCPNIDGARLQGQACQTKTTESCFASCDHCVVCNKTTAADDSCASACDRCMGHICIDALGECAASEGCMGPLADQCSRRCTNCFACLNSNDHGCDRCKCCSACFPVAAKCGLLSRAFDDFNYAYVAVFNHRRYYNTREAARAIIDISLRQEPHYVQPKLASNWIGELYNNFENVQDVEQTDRTRYADDAQFLYNFDLIAAKSSRKRVKLFADRLTLLRIVNPANLQGIDVSFAAGPNIAYVLSSQAAAPKTFFDFDREHIHSHGTVHIDAVGTPNLWVAIFAGKVDAFVDVTVDSVHTNQGTHPLVLGLACIFALVCLLLVSGSLYSRRDSSQNSDDNRSDEKTFGAIGGFLSFRGSAASTGERNAGHSLQSYMSADQTLDREVEEKYLFRGGIGDDGM